jgi:hypothetical protein
MVHHVQTTPLFEAKDLSINVKLFNGNPTMEEHFGFEVKILVGRVQI